MNRISLVIPSLQSGGMERVMSELAEQFVKMKRTEVHLILYGKNRGIFFPIPGNIKIHRPTFVFTDYPRTVSTVKTLLFLRRTIKKNQPDRILSFGEYWNNFVLLALWGLKIPIYISDRCQPDKSLGKFHDRMRKWLYPGAAGIIAQTSEAKQIYTRQGLNANIRVIGNPIYQVETNDSANKKENIVLTVGRLIESKHHDRLIKIFKDLSLSEWKLFIVGGDALKQNGSKRLHKLVKELNMEDKVKFTGTVSDVQSYYKKSKIFAFTSSSEGFPNVIGEAMSAGLPVIAYDCIAGPSALVEDSNTGFLISLFDDAEYAKKLKLLVNSAELRTKMGREGKKNISKYKPGKIAEKFYSFISNSEQTTRHKSGFYI